MIQPPTPSSDISGTKARGEAPLAVNVALDQIGGEVVSGGGAGVKRD